MLSREIGMVLEITVSLAKITADLAQLLRETGMPEEAPDPDFRIRLKSTTVSQPLQVNHCESPTVSHPL